MYGKVFVIGKCRSEWQMWNITVVYECSLLKAEEVHEAEPPPTTKWQARLSIIMNLFASRPHQPSTT